jgi:hypothetical protein
MEALLSLTTKTSLSSVVSALRTLCRLENVNPISITLTTFKDKKQNIYFILQWKQLNVITVDIISLSL